jgi:hypothetical protein
MLHIFSTSCLCGKLYFRSEAEKNSLLFVKTLKIFKQNVYLKSTNPFTNKTLNDLRPYRIFLIPIYIVSNYLLRRQAVLVVAILFHHSQLNQTT